jgi:hypothetical protein
MGSRNSLIFAVMYRDDLAIASHVRNFVGRVENAWQAQYLWLKIVHQNDLPERYAFATIGPVIVAPDREC